MNVEIQIDFHCGFLQANHPVMIEYETPRLETKILSWTFQKKPTLLNTGLCAFTKSKIIQTEECSNFYKAQHMQLRERTTLAIAAYKTTVTGLVSKMQ